MTALIPQMAMTGFQASKPKGAIISPRMDAKVTDASEIFDLWPFTRACVGEVHGPCPRRNAMLPQMAIDNKPADKLNMHLGEKATMPFKWGSACRCTVMCWGKTYAGEKHMLGLSVRRTPARLMQVRNWIYLQEGIGALATKNGGFRDEDQPNMQFSICTVTRRKGE